MFLEEIEGRAFLISARKALNLVLEPARAAMSPSRSLKTKDGSVRLA
jgi:hypothetical protein